VKETVLLLLLAEVVMYLVVFWPQLGRRGERRFASTVSRRCRGKQCASVRIHLAEK